MSIGFFFDPRGTVAEIIEKWQPFECKTERDFKKSLLDELRKKLKDKNIIEEYGSGKQKIDIVVQDKVPIELKKDLKSNAQLHRTLGQVEEYLTKWEYLLLVLCGEIAPDFLKSLEAYAGRKYYLSSLNYDSKVHIINKGIIS
jgi:hypothetical protein